MADRFDVIVVGAGPAGSSTAYRLASAGASVLLVDRARFPRDKPCGGGLTGRARREAPAPLDPVVVETAGRVELRLGYRDRTRLERWSSPPLVLMTERRRLDAYLVERAAAAGADLREGSKATAVEVAPNGVVVTVDRTRVAAAAVVGADGANGIAARAPGLGGRLARGVALEGNVPYGAADRERYRDRMVFELGTIAGGYGWIFPKQEHVNVGVAGWEREGPVLRAHLRRLLSAHGLPEETLRELRGHRLPVRRPGFAAARGRALLVGDAAGLVDPASGEGLHGAFLSARLAADAVLGLLAGRAGSLEPYETALARELAPYEAIAWRARRAVDRFPRATFALARLPVAWTAVLRIYGDVSRSPAERPRPPYALHPRVRG